MQCRQDCFYWRYRKGATQISINKLQEAGKEMESKEKIIEYITKNRVSTTEVADCLGKTGVVENVFPLNRGHFAVGEVQYLYAIQDSNWTVHEDLDAEPVSGKVIFIDAIDVHNRAVIGDLVSKYILLYMGNKAVVCTGRMRDAH